MSLELVHAGKDIWVNIGDGNIECVVYDGPNMGFDKKPRAMIRFRSGWGKLMDEGIPIEHVVARLSGKPTTDLGHEWWCEGNLMEGTSPNQHCERLGWHGPHGYDIPEVSNT